MTTKARENLASYIDHTLLKPDASSADVERLVQEAVEYRFFGVCVNSRFVPDAAAFLSQYSGDYQPKLVSVVGFPLGAMASAAKAFETEWAVKNGADEIDMVLSIGDLKAGKTNFVRNDIYDVVSAAGTTPVKVILETALLSYAEKNTACLIAKEVGASFVKTCTGFGGGGATVDDIQLMRSAVGAAIGVKASGGIKTQQQAWQLIDAGANRLGTSSGIALVRAENASGGY